MHEMLFVTSGSRAPVVMAVANRALSSPLNIHGDHSDSMAERDSGWIHIYVENAQEAYDSIIQAFKIAEDVDVSLPIIVGLDGFTISHTLEKVDSTFRRCSQTVRWRTPISNGAYSRRKNRAFQA